MNNLVIVLIISSIVLAGFIGWLLNLRKIRGEERAINDFCNHSLKLLKESKKNKYSQETLTYIVSNYNYISKIIPEHYPHMPVYSLGLAIRDGKAYEIESNVNQIQIDTVSSIAEHERQFKKQCKGWWNIFDLFFRGVGLLLRIVFGYQIQMIKPDFSFHSKGWNTFSAIVGLIGSVASIISLIIK